MNHDEKEFRIEMGDAITRRLELDARKAAMPVISEKILSFLLHDPLFEAWLSLNYDMKLLMQETEIHQTAFGNAPLTVSANLRFTAPLDVIIKPAKRPPLKIALLFIITQIVRWIRDRK